MFTLSTASPVVAAQEQGLLLAFRRMTRIEQYPNGTHATQNAQVISMDQTKRADRHRRNIDKFYKDNGNCCAGCDWWRYHNALIGDCTKSAPVSGDERISMIDITWTSLDVESGHIMTKRDHVCGDFVDNQQSAP